MKKTGVAILTLGFLIGSCSWAMAAEPEILYNGQPLTPHQPVVIENGRTLLGLRDMADQMQIAVHWDSSTRLATLRNQEQVITLQPDLQRILINDIPQNVDVGPQLIENHIYLPVRYLFEMLGGDVFYRSYEDGRTVISVNSYDSYRNYQTIEGRLTKVVRKVEKDSRSSTVLVNHSSNVMELIPQGSQIEVYSTRSGLVNEEKKLLDSNHSTTIYDILEYQQKYWALLEKPSDRRYLGDMIVPEGKPMLDQILTPQGEYTLYGGSSYLAALDLEGKEGFIDLPFHGYVLDLSGNKNGVKHSSYAINSKNVYGFLTDGQLLLVGTDPYVDEGFYVKSCNTISPTMQTGQVFTYGDTFYIIAVDQTASGQQELFTTTYAHNGLKANSYVQASHFSTDAQYRYIEIVDTAQTNEKAHLLLRINQEMYLASWDLLTNELFTEKLDRKYIRFVPYNGSSRLYCADEQYYYFYQLP